MSKITSKLLCAAVALVIGPLNAAAQPGPGPGLPSGLPPGLPPMFGGPGFGLPGPPLVPPMFLAEQLSPMEICLEMNAMRAGYIAYIRARLDLTSAQLPLWRDVEANATETSQQVRGDCERLPNTPGKPGLSAVLSGAERYLAAKQQGLQRLSVPLLKLYEALSSDQRTIIDRSLPPPIIF
jgi:hypothetical protein